MGSGGAQPPATIMRANLPTPRRALAICAHPDDIEFGCGATFAKWSAAGCEIVHLVCTDGSKGTWDKDADTAALVATRRDEQRAAAVALGGTGEVVFLGEVDGELDVTSALTATVARWIRHYRPDVVLGHDPWRRWRLHPDHRAAGWLTCDGAVAARDPHFFPHDGLGHHRPGALLLFETEAPNHVEDVTGFAGHKVEALLAHASQKLSTMRIPADDDGTARAAFDLSIREVLARAGRLIGTRHGEAFRLIEL